MSQQHQASLEEKQKSTQEYESKLESLHSQLNETKTTLSSTLEKLKKVSQVKEDLSAKHEAQQTENAKLVADLQTKVVGN